MAAMVGGAALKTVMSTAVNSQIRGFKERGEPRPSLRLTGRIITIPPPPTSGVLHYNLDDVEDANAKFAVRIANINYLMACSTFCVNCFGTFVLACGGLNEGGAPDLRHLQPDHIQHRRHVRVLQGVQGPGDEERRLTDYYLGLQVLFIIFFFVASIVSGANYYRLDQREARE